MTLLRALLTGVAAAFGVVLVLAIAASLRLDDRTALALLSVPLALLAGASLLGRSSRRWPSRVGSGLVGGLLSAAAAIGAVFYLRQRHPWFDYGGDQGYALFLLLLAGFAAVPGAAASAAPVPAHGFGLALGFTAGITAGMTWSPPLNPGLVILMAIGVGVGTLVCLVRRGE